MPYVVINDDKLIPGVGQGPITTPIEISEGLCNRLILMGYTVLKQPEHSIHIRSLNRVDRLRLQRLATKTEIDKSKTSTSILDKVKAISERKEQAEEEPESTVEEETPENVPPVEEQPTPTDNVVEDVPAAEPTESSEENEEEASVSVEEMTKSQLKNILDDNNVDYKYHDNRSTLISKAKDLV